MSERTHILCKRPLAGDGARFSRKQWNDRIESARAELLCDLPSLRSLTASTLTHETEVSGGSVFSIFSIRETGQTTLRFHSARRSIHDAFSNDLERILIDQINLRERYEHALKTQDVESLDADIIAIRQRIYSERGSGEVTLHSSTNGEQFEFDAPPRVLPKSPVFCIESKVTDISAHMVRVVPVADKNCRDMSSMLLGNRKWLDLRRSKPSQGLSVGLTLVTALELQHVVRLQIAAEILWVDVSSKSFVLLGICD